MAGTQKGPGLMPGPLRHAVVVGTGVDPVTYRFSGDRSAY